MHGLEAEHFKTILNLEQPDTGSPISEFRRAIYDGVYDKFLKRILPHYQIWEEELFPVMGKVGELRKRVEQRLDLPVDDLPTYSYPQAERLANILRRVENNYPIPDFLRGRVELGIELKVQSGTLKEDLDVFCKQVNRRRIQRIPLYYDDIGKLKLIPLHLRDGISGFYDPLLDLQKATYTFDVSHTPGLSLKDVIAKYMVEKATEYGDLLPGQPISESSSGNTGVGLALVGLCQGRKVVLYTTDRSSRSKIDRLLRLGAHVIMKPNEVKFSNEELENIGGSVSGYVNGKIGCYYVDQHEKIENMYAHYFRTASFIPREILNEITAIIVPVGTYGSFVGLGMFFRDCYKDIKYIGVDADGGVLHQTTPKERFYLEAEDIAKRAVPHRLQGFGGAKISKHLRALDPSKVISVGVGADEAELAARTVLPILGYPGGQSSGAVYAAIQKCLRLGILGRNDTVLAVCTDLGFQYADDTLYQFPQATHEW